MPCKNSVKFALSYWLWHSESFALCALAKVDGSIVLWDLRESSGLHRVIKDSSSDDTENCLRQPTYNTGKY